MTRKRLLDVVCIAAVGYFGWLGIQVVNIKTEVTVSSVQLKKNTQMLVPLWEDLVIRRSSVDTKQGLDEQANFQAGK